MIAGRRRKATRSDRLAPAPCVMMNTMTELHFWPIAQCLVLLTLANGVPPIAKKMLGDWLAWPIDGGRLFWDGQPLLGKSKTLRGFVLATLATAIGAPLVGLDIETGVLSASPPWSATYCRASSNVAWV